MPLSGGASSSEIHLFAYLACLLSLYNSEPVSTWGYRFAGTKEGAPFSPDIAQAISLLYTSGNTTEKANLYTITGIGLIEYEDLSVLSQNTRRDMYVEGACSATYALPIGLVRQALLQEPVLRRATTLSTARQLLELADLSTLYAQFDSLSRAIGVDTSELMVPAVTWLTYLLRTAKNATDAKDLEDPSRA
jgi:hypothetical protein